MLVDLLHLSRALRRSPASAAAAILTLSLTLGAGASIFAVVHAVLTPPPFRDPHALVIVGEKPLEEPSVPPRRVSHGTFEAWRERAGSLAFLEAFDGTNLTLTGLGSAERVSANDVTPGFLKLLGVEPALGRAFEPGDAGRPVAIISDAFWRRELSSDAGVIGRQIVLGNEPHTVVGVLSERFLFELNQADIWRPLPLTPAEATLAGYPVGVVARLAPGASPASLEAALEGVSRAAAPPMTVATIPVGTAISRDATRMVGLLAGAASLAMLIAFANFAGLLVVRSMDRRRELAIRSALGARRSEIAKQLVLEAEAIVAIGTICGLLLALWATPALARLALEQFGGVAHRDAPVTWQVVAGVAIAASVCAAICALLPARAVARWSVIDLLRRGASPPPRDKVMRRSLVTAEVALAFVLLACVTLVGGSLLRLLKVEPGFDARGVMALQVSVPAASYGAERVASFYAALQDAVEERLGPLSTAIVNEIPLTGDGGRGLVSVRPDTVGAEAVVREAGRAYFEVMRIPIVAGRSFERRDDRSAPKRVVISESLARTLFASRPPIGRRILLAATAEMAEVIGVAGEVRHRALDEDPLPTLYLSLGQAPSRSNILVVRSGRPPVDVITAVREEVARLDPKLPVYRVRSMQDVVNASPGLPARRVLSAAFTVFALLAVVLAVIGLFGVAAHDVHARRAELAVRIALGADPTRVVAATLHRGAVMVAWGLVLGGLLSMWAARALGAAGFATGRLDALSVCIPAAILAVAGTAGVLPAARRAARTDPLTALRSE